ncbi:hypothetical protein PR048_030167, partial [Dryococelus australis]
MVVKTCAMGVRVDERSLVARESDKEWGGGRERASWRRDARRFRITKWPVAGLRGSTNYRIITLVILRARRRAAVGDRPTARRRRARCKSLHEAVSPPPPNAFLYTSPGAAVAAWLERPPPITATRVPSSDGMIACKIIDYSSLTIVTQMSTVNCTFSYNCSYKRKGKWSDSCELGTPLADTGQERMKDPIVQPASSTLHCLILAVTDFPSARHFSRRSSSSLKLNHSSIQQLLLNSRPGGLSQCLYSADLDLESSMRPEYCLEKPGPQTTRTFFQLNTETQYNKGQQRVLRKDYRVGSLFGNRYVVLGLARACNSKHSIDLPLPLSYNYCPSLPLARAGCEARRWRPCFACQCDPYSSRASRPRKKKKEEKNDKGRQRYDGNTARLARTSDEALGVHVTVVRIAPSLPNLGARSYIVLLRTLPTGWQVKNFVRKSRVKEISPQRQLYTPVRTTGGFTSPTLLTLDAASCYVQRRSPKPPSSQRPRHRALQQERFNFAAASRYAVTLSSGLVKYWYVTASYTFLGPCRYFRNGLECELEPLSTCAVRMRCFFFPERLRFASVRTRERYFLERRALEHYEQLARYLTERGGRREMFHGNLLQKLRVTGTAFTWSWNTLHESSLFGPSLLEGRPRWKENQPRGHRCAQLTVNTGNGRGCHSCGHVAGHGGSCVTQPTNQRAAIRTYPPYPPLFHQDVANWAKRACFSHTLIALCTHATPSRGAPAKAIFHDMSYISLSEKYLHKDHINSLIGCAELCDWASCLISRCFLPKSSLVVGLLAGDGWRTATHVGSQWRQFTGNSVIQAVHDKVSTFEINRIKNSLPLPANILTGAPIDMRPEKLVAMDGTNIWFHLNIKDVYSILWFRVNSYTAGAAVAEWLDYSPPTKTNLSQFHAGSLPGFSRVGIAPEDATRWRLFSGISRPSLAFRRRSVLTSLQPHRLPGPSNSRLARKHLANPITAKCGATANEHHTAEAPASRGTSFTPKQFCPYAISWLDDFKSHATQVPDRESWTFSIGVLDYDWPSQIRMSFHVDTGPITKGSCGCEHIRYSCTVPLESRPKSILDSTLRICVNPPSATCRPRQLRDWFEKTSSSPAAPGWGGGGGALWSRDGHNTELASPAYLQLFCVPRSPERQGAMGDTRTPMKQSRGYFYTQGWRYYSLICLQHTTEYARIYPGLRLHMETWRVRRFILGRAEIQNTCVYVTSAIGPHGVLTPPGERGRRASERNDVVRETCVSTMCKSASHLQGSLPTAAMTCPPRGRCRSSDAYKTSTYNLPDRRRVTIVSATRREYCALVASRFRDLNVPRRHREEIALDGKMYPETNRLNHPADRKQQQQPVSDTSSVTHTSIPCCFVLRNVCPLALSVCEDILRQKGRSKESTERHRNEGVGETGDPRYNPPPRAASSDTIPTCGNTGQSGHRYAIKGTTTPLFRLCVFVYSVDGKYQPLATAAVNKQLLETWKFIAFIRGQARVSHWLCATLAKGPRVWWLPWIWVALNNEILRADEDEMRLPLFLSGINPRPGHSAFSHVGIVPEDAVVWFSWVSPVSPALSFRRCSILTSFTFIGSQGLDVKNRSNIFTHYVNYMDDHRR